MVRNNAERWLHVRIIRICARMLRGGRNERHEEIRLKITDLALNDGGHAVEPIPGVYGGLRQRMSARRSRRD